MKKLLSILLTLTMMISLVAAFSTVSFAEETSVYAEDEYDATAEKFTLEVYAAKCNNKRFRAARPTDSWDVAAQTWLLANGYGENDPIGKYHLEADENGGYKVVSGSGSKNNYSIDDLARTLKKQDVDKSPNECHIGGYWINGGNFNINKFPYDFDIKLGEKAYEVSGVRIYPSHSGDDGSWVKKYEVWAKFENENDYICLISDGVSTSRQVVTANFGYNVKVTDLRVVIKEAKGAHYYTIGGMTVLNKKDDLVTYENSAELRADYVSAMIDERVVGSRENIESIEAAETLYGVDAVKKYRDAYEAKDVKEVDTAFGTAQVKYINMNSDSQTYNQEVTYNVGKLTDGIVSDDGVLGARYQADANFSVYPELNQYLTITIPVTTTEPFTGIRFYSRKADSPWISYQNVNSAKLVKVTLYGDNGETSVTTGVLSAVEGEKGIYKAAEDTEATGSATWNKSDADKQHRENIDYRYSDIALSFNNKAVKVKNVKKIVVEVQQLFQADFHHWGAEEVRLIDDKNVIAEAKTVSTLRPEIIKGMIDERVIGSLENKNTLAAATKLYTVDEVAEYQKKYDDKTVKELDAISGNITIDYYEHGTTKKTRTGSETARLNDGVISPEDMTENKGTDYSVNVDHGVYGYETSNPKQNLVMTIPVDSGTQFTGIRFYSRKSAQFNYYQIANTAKKADVALYDDAGNIVAIANLAPVSGEEHGIVNADNTTLKITHDRDGKPYTLEAVNDKGETYNPYQQYNGDIMYADFKLVFNGAEVRAKDVEKIVITVKELYGNNNNHWGSEEVRLIDDSGVKTTKTVAEIKNDLIKADNQIAITTVETGEMKKGTEGENGIINIITTFNKLVAPAKVEYFGTYAIGFNESGNTNPLATDITADNGNVGVYKVSEIESDKLNEGATYSVQVTGIKKDWYSVPVYAISFVKVEGLDELIFSTSTKIESIDTENQYDK